MSSLQAHGAKIGTAMIAGAFLLMATMLPSWSLPGDELAKFSAARERFINDFRVSGETDPRPLLALEPDLAHLALQATGEVHAKALLELADYRRLARRFTRRE